MFNTEKLENFYLQLIKIGSLVIIFLPLFAYDKFIFPFVFPRTILFLRQFAGHTKRLLRVVALK